MGTEGPGPSSAVQAALPGLRSPPWRTIMQSVFLSQPCQLRACPAPALHSVGTLCKASSLPVLVTVSPVPVITSQVTQSHHRFTHDGTTGKHHLLSPHCHIYSVTYIILFRYQMRDWGVGLHCTIISLPKWVFSANANFFFLPLTKIWN